MNIIIGYKNMQYTHKNDILNTFVSKVFINKKYPKESEKIKDILGKMNQKYISISIYISDNRIGNHDVQG